MNDDSIRTSTTFASHTRKTTIRVLKALGIHPVLQRTLNRLPDPLLKLAVRYGGKRELVPRTRLTAVYIDALQRLKAAAGRQPLGDYLEFGVYQGTAMLCMAEAMRALGLTEMRLFGFDSFEGLPPNASEEDSGVWKPGEFSSSLEYTRAYLKHHGVDMSRLHLIKGWFSETLTEQLKAEYNIHSASVLMFDCDLYSSTRDALAFGMPLLCEHGVVLFDDWHSRGLSDQNLGERRAFEEYLAQNPAYSVEEMPSYDEMAKVFWVMRVN